MSPPTLERGRRWEELEVSSDRAQFMFRSEKSLAEWLTEAADENSFRSRNSFMCSILQAFREHYLSLPQDARRNMVESIRNDDE